MNNYFDEEELIRRIRKADPAKNINFELGEEILEKAIKKGTVSKTNRVRAFSLAGATTAVVAALAVTFTSLPGTNQEILISLGGTNGQAGAPNVASTEDAKLGMIWQPYNYTYVPGDELSKESGKGNAYKFELSGDPETKLKELAKFFNISDTKIVQNPYEYDENNYVIGDYQNYLKPSINLYWNGLGTWYYSNPTAYENTIIDDRCYAVPEVADGYTSDGSEGAVAEPAPIDSTRLDCEPTPPTNLPTKEEALAEAWRIISTLGIDIAKEDLQVNVDTWGVSVYGNGKVEGQAVSLDFYVSWAGEKIAYASGTFAKPVLIGEVPLISEYDAVSRVSDWIWWGTHPNTDYFAMPMSRDIAVSGGSVSSSDAIKSEDGTSDSSGGSRPSEGVSEPSEGSSTPSKEPDLDAVNPDLLPPDYEAPEPKDVTVVFNKAKSQLLMVWDSEGTPWLLPGYIFSSDNKEYYGSAPIIAVDPKVINLNR